MAEPLPSKSEQQDDAVSGVLAQIPLTATDVCCDGGAAHGCEVESNRLNQSEQNEINGSTLCGDACNSVSATAPGTRLSSWIQRVVLSMVAGTVMSLLMAGVDAVFAASPSTSWGEMALGAWGVGGAGFYIIAMCTALFCILAHPNHPPCLKRAVKWLRENREPQSLNRALMLPIAIVGFWLWITISAHIARTIFSNVNHAAVAAMAIAISTVLAATAMLLMSLSVFASLHSTISVRKQEIRTKFRAWWTGGVAAVTCVAMALWGLFSGSTGGEGGVFGFMGVMRRLELDLKAPSMFALVALTSYFAPAVRVKHRAWLAVLAIFSLLPILAMVHTAWWLNHSPKVVSALEQHSPIARMWLPGLRKMTDRDGDGASAYFGGGDCDDSNDNVHPLAPDIAGDGIDQDCSGTDTAVNRDQRNDDSEPSKDTVKIQLADHLNVLLITVDTLRWDMGFMGYDREISPAMDALAAKSTVFEHTYAMSAYTGKAIGPMMSGKYPSETSMGWSHYNKYPPSDRMVQERLQKAGVFTISIQCHWYFKPATGIGRGFDVFDISALPAGGIDATTDTTYSADRLSDAAIRVLSDPSNTRKPFFAWVHYFDPHAEYLHHPGTQDFGRAKARDMYDHEVRWTDDQIKRLIDFVNEQSWGKNTAIILTADHGEAFGEHGMYRHGFEVWDEVVRVPLIVHVPGAPPKRVKHKRSLIDLVPTILDLMKVKPGQAEDDKDFLSGQSLLTDIFAEAGTTEAAEQREILVDMPPGPFNQARRAYIRGDYKLIIAGGIRYQLYDLKQDPGEKEDLASNEELLKQQREHYDRFRSKLRQVVLKPPK